MTSRFAGNPTYPLKFKKWISESQCFLMTTALGWDLKVSVSFCLTRPLGGDLGQITSPLCLHFPHLGIKMLTSFNKMFQDIWVKKSLYKFKYCVLREIWKPPQCHFAAVKYLHTVRLIRG